MPSAALVIDREGRPRTLLEPGQEKAISTDRVILVPGPQGEQEIVRRIFRWYGRNALTLDEIAAAPSRRRTANRYWPAVDPISRSQNHLQRGLYRGLHLQQDNRFAEGARKPAPREHWVRSSTLAPMVSDRVFRAAQKQRARRDGKRLPDERLLRGSSSCSRARGIPFRALDLEVAEVSVSHNLRQPLPVASARHTRSSATPRRCTGISARSVGLGMMKSFWTACAGSMRRMDTSPAT